MASSLEGKERRGTRQERLRRFLDDELGDRARGYRFQKQRKWAGDHEAELRLWAIWRDIKLAHPELTATEKQDIGVALRAAFILGQQWGKDIYTSDDS